MKRLQAWYRIKLRDPLLRLPWQLRVACSVVGFIGGVFPFPALTTVVTLALCRWCSLTVPQTAVATVINLVLAPLQLLLIPVFAVMGTVLTGADNSQFTMTVLKAALDDGVGTLLKQTTSMLMHAFLVWCLICVSSLALLKLAGFVGPSASHYTNRRIV